MMTTIQNYLQKGLRQYRRLRADPTIRIGTGVLLHGLSGFLLSAAGLGGSMQPIAAGAVFAAEGWQSVALGLGSAVGYLLFWSEAQGLLWVGAGLLVALLLGDRPTAGQPLLLSALAALLVASGGLAFQIWAGDPTPIPLYVLRIVTAGGSVLLFREVKNRSGPVARWICCGVVVLALAQLLPFPYLGLGFIAAAAVTTVSAFPAAALAGLALDLARVSSVPMTAVLCLSWLLRLIPGIKRRWLHLAPGAAYLLVMALCGLWDLYPLPAIALGGLGGLLLPGEVPLAARRGPTGSAQVRLELAAEMLSESRLLLADVQPAPVDEAALITRAAGRVCGSCPCRKTCRDREAVGQMSASVLSKTLLDPHDLEVTCRKPGRLLAELQRTQEQLRSIRADRKRQEEYRSAVTQQYRFLAEYLRDLSDSLGRQLPIAPDRFEARVAFCANRRKEENGDCCLSFSGVGGKHYVLLCDGMGKGFGAVEEGKSAGALLRGLLTAGFPAQYALRSLSSLCALRGVAGVATVDLAELHLDSGKVFLYKWGAAPSWLLTRTGAEKIGTTGPPPGLADGRETVERLSLRRGQTLVLVSDGLDGEESLRRCISAPEQPLGEVAADVLERGIGENADDATVAAIRLIPLHRS